MHEIVGALLPFSGKVAIGEMVAFQGLMGSTVRKHPMCTALEARPVAALAEL